MRFVLSVSPADRAWVQGRWKLRACASCVSFQYPLRIERGCKAQSRRDAQGGGGQRCFQYPLRIERGCKQRMRMHRLVAALAFSIPCGSSVGASGRVCIYAARHLLLSVSPADRAWVQEKHGRAAYDQALGFQYPLRIERGCK